MFIIRYLIKEDYHMVFYLSLTIQQQEYLTREEVASILKISMSTISEWNRKGILNPYRLGNSIRYKSNELDQVLIKINK